MQRSIVIFELRAAGPASDNIPLKWLSVIDIP